MKKIILCICLLFCVTLCKAQKTNKTIDAIKDNTERTALHTKKGEYEYITLTISLLAFVIASVTLYYSVKTYRSQKKTERNTALWGVEDERRIIKELGIHMANSLAYILTIEKSMVQENMFPSEGDFIRMKYNPERLHLNINFDLVGIRKDLSELYDNVTNLNSHIDWRTKQISTGTITSAISSPSCRFFTPFHLEVNKQFVAGKKYFDEEKMIICKSLHLISILYEKMWLPKEKAQKIAAFEITKLNKELPQYVKNHKLSTYIDNYSLYQIFERYYYSREKEILEYLNDKNHNYSKPYENTEHIVLAISYDVNVNDRYREDVDLTPINNNKPVEYISNGILYLNATSYEEFERVLSITQKSKTLSSPPKIIRPFDKIYCSLLFDIDNVYLNLPEFRDIFHTIAKLRSNKEKVPGGIKYRFSQLLQLREIRKVIYTAKKNSVVYEIEFIVSSEIINEAGKSTYHLFDWKNCNKENINLEWIDPFDDFVMFDIGVLFQNYSSINRIFAS